MSRGSPIAAVVFAILFLTPKMSLAQTSEIEFLSGLSLSAALGYAIPNTDEYENAFSFQLAAGYRVTDMLSLEAGLGRFASTVSQPGNGISDHTIASGDLRIIPLTLTAQIHYPMPEMFTLVYGLAGIGYYFVDYSWSSKVESEFKEIKKQYPRDAVNQEVENGFGIHLGGGLDYPLTGNLTLNTEGRYIILTPQARGQWRDRVTGMPNKFDEDLDLNTWIFTVGIKCLF